MGRPEKLTKHSIHNAIARNSTFTAAAAYAGVNRRTFQRAMKAMQYGTETIQVVQTNRSGYKQYALVKE